MSHLFVYTPGSNDMKLYLENGELLPGNKTIFELSKQVVSFLTGSKEYWMFEKGIVCHRPLEITFENTKQHITTIIFPIIAALTAYIHEHVKQNKKERQEADDTDSVIFLLIASRQTPPNQQDTLYICDLIKKYLGEYHKVKDVLIEEITCNVSDYDAVSRFFQELMEKQHTLFHNALELYRILGPGTPAMNIGGMHIDFAFHAKNLYAERTSSGDTVIKDMEFFSLFKRRDEADSLTLFLDNYNYKPAAVFLKKSFLRPEKVITDALTLIDHRKHMNYKQGCMDSEVYKACYIKKAADKGLYNFLYSQICFFNKVKQHTPDSPEMKKIAVREFYYLMENDIKTGDYNALIAHLFTLFENLDEYLFYTLTGKTFVKAEKEGFVELREFLAAHEAVQKEILKQTGKDDISKIEPNLEVKKIIFDVPGQNSPRADLLREYKEIQKKSVYKLRELRNKGPFAHGHCGVNAATFTWEMLYKEKGAGGLLELTYNALALQGLEVLKDKPGNPYDAFNAKVCRYIEGLM